MDGKYDQDVKYTVNGETHSLSQWAKILGISKHTLKQRLQRDPSEVVLILPLKPSVTMLVFNGRT